MRKGLLSAARRAAMLAVMVMLSGCKAALMDPQGPVGIEERRLILTALGLMLLVVIPVIVMTLCFARKYRASNKKAVYLPDWSHSTKIELVVWLVPCLIILVLAFLTWKTSHALDPFKPLSNGEEKPLTIEVVALDWKWLFIYPDQQLASVNEVAIPVGVPVRFKVTSDTVMNAFFIPQLGSQIYAMAGMQTEVNLKASQAGVFDGMSANYSGAGFSKMSFKARAMSKAGFANWISQAKQSMQSLDLSHYKLLAQASQQHPITYYSTVTPHLFSRVIQHYRPENVAVNRTQHEVQE